MTRDTASDFYGLGLAPALLSVLERHGFVRPTPIQAQTIPVAITGKDVVGIAQTGTGKTLAFGLPMMQNIARRTTRGLVIVPTRELAAQVDDVLLQFGKTLGLRTAVVVGGASEVRQRRALQRAPHVIIATPGRLIDHLSGNASLLQHIGILILDEADRMLDMGFAPQIEKILAQVPGQRQTMLFSATMPDTIMRMANKHMQKPLRIEIAKPGTVVKEVDQEVIFLEQKEKRSMLQKLLVTYRGSILIFSRTKWGAKKLATAIRDMGHTAADISANRSLAQRTAAIEGFKKGQHRVLVATDIAARGIDVRNIEVVINFDLPSTPDDYVHRIGRTARAGKRGKAISFATADQRRDVRAIETMIRMQLTKGGTPAGMARTASGSERGTPSRPPSYRGRKKRSGHHRRRPSSKQRSPHRRRTRR